MSKVFAILIVSLFLLEMVLVSSAISEVDQTVEVIATITVGTGPEAVAYDSGTGEIFVANYGPPFATAEAPGSVSVISDSNNSVVATIQVGVGPVGLAYDSGKNEIFVAHSIDNTVSIISDQNYSVIATVPVGEGPHGVAYDSGKNEIFVANSGDNSVSVISDVTNTVVATIPVGKNPHGVVYDSAKGEIFVTNYGVFGEISKGTVSVISDSTNTVVATIPVGANPYGITYDSGTGEIYVANGVDNSVSVISDSSNSVVATVPVKSNPWGVAYDSGTGEIFVTNYWDNSVSVISDITHSVVATVSVGSSPSSVAYDSGKGEAFVTNEYDGTVSVIQDSSWGEREALAASPHQILIEKPSNNTTYGDSLPLNVTVSFLETDGIISWQTLNSLNYSVDDKPPVNIISSEAFLSPPINIANVTISGLADGQHKLVMTAVFVANVSDVSMLTYTFTSDPVYFTVNTESQLESFPTLLVAAASVAIVAAVAVGLLVYFKKRKR
jgi:YVTN family beta-propeller protein